MDQNFNQSADSYIGKLDHHHLLHLLREKEILIETLRREVNISLIIFFY